jgi:CBS domain-containing protein
MVMLSDFLRYAVVDGRGQRAKPVDLSIDLSGGDYPPVTRLVYHGPDRQQRAVDWAAVRGIEWRLRQVRVADLEAGRPTPPDALGRAVLLRRDVLDALLLDLANRQTTRANDLWLREEGARLRLRAADVAPWAVLRRLGRGFLGLGADRNLLDWKNVEFLRGNPETARSGGDYHRRVASLPPAEIARLAEALPYLHAAELLTLIPDQVAADALEAMSPERKVQVYEELDPDRAGRLLALMAPDVAADLVGRLEPDLAQRSLNALPGPQRDRLVQLLRYPEDTAGGIMTNDVIAVPEQLTVAEARQAMSDKLKEPDFVYYVYVVDGENACRLCGVLTLREFLLSEDSRRLEQIMNRQLQMIDPLESAVEAARRVADTGLAALPVVARDGRLLGAVTFDSAMAQIAPPAWRAQVPRVFS